MAPLSQSYPDAVRRPALSIRMGGGLGPTASAAGEDPWQRSTRSIMSRCALAPHVDLALIALSNDAQAPAVAVDDAGEIALGYEDAETTLVFTATVDKIYLTIHGFQCIETANGSSALGRFRINQSYEKQSAGDIVSDLASQAGVQTDAVESGVDLPFYVVDDRRSAWEQIAQLARMSGFAAYFTVEDKLCFKALAQGQPAQTFTYGLDILAFQASQSPGPALTFAVVGEGAAGSQGEEAWSWLIKDPSSVTAEAGGGPIRKVISSPALRSSQSAQTAADGLAAETQQKVNIGRIITPGAPAVVVGSTIEVADLPADELNGVGLVTRVIHEFSKTSGFISRIDFYKPGNGGGGVP
ncbi:MAG: hypothetical protein M0036_16095 [Desulfobacteraceae bacterium]|nr:hypothetical protein [Desulfobacteraceae bacterium]